MECLQHEQEASLPATIDRATYKTWEKAVVEAFYDKEQKKTGVIPKDGEPAVVVKEKVVIVVIEGDGSLVEKVAKRDTSDLAPTRYIQLFHIGKGGLDGVKLGLDDNKGEFVYAAIDTGGLTNYCQKLGELAALEPEREIVVSADGDPQAVGNQLFSMYCEISKKDFPDYLRGSFAEIVKTIASAFDGRNAVLRFLRRPPMHMVCVTSNDVIQKTGNYYVRCRGKGDDNFAAQSDGKDLFAAVYAESIVPNWNWNNIQFEHRSY